MANSWKTSLGAKEHRLEAYATLTLQSVERCLKSVGKFLPKEAGGLRIPDGLPVLMSF